MQENIYQDLTRSFNEGRLRAILSSGQAVVMHRLAVMSKDGDWILREDDDALEHILAVLESRGAHYRFGAPLDSRWMNGGWSAHFEFRTESLRVRTDFVVRPPRIPTQELAALWARAAARRNDVPFVDVPTLIQLKKTNRERDYAVIGELARLESDPMQQMLVSRSARDLMALAEARPELLRAAAGRRELLKHVHEGRDALEAALDAERRALIRANEARLEAYRKAAEAWHGAWPAVSSEVGGLPLRQAHERLVERAGGLLPCHVEGASS
jgi:hypothetical protein